MLVSAEPRAREIAFRIDREAGALASLGTEADVGGAASGKSAPIVTAGRRPLDWSGVTLSPQLLDMLNVVALAALKMADKSSAAPYSPAQPTEPRERHSI